MPVHNLQGLYQLCCPMHRTRHLCDLADFGLQVQHQFVMYRWRFSVQGMGDHMVAVALGPPEDVVDAWGVLNLNPLLSLDLILCVTAAHVHGAFYAAIASVHI